MKTGGSCGKTGSKWGTPVDRIDKILNHDLFLYHLERTMRQKQTDASAVIVWYIF